MTESGGQSTDGRTEDLAPRAARVRPRGGGLLIEPDGDGAIRLLPRDGVLWVEGPEEVAGWVLRRATSSEGLVLERPGDDGEAGRTSSIFEGVREANLYYLLMGDGRLYRIALGEPRGAVFELRGWETSGAYLKATPDDAGWTITPAPAGSALPDLRALMILFAAEILDSEGSLDLSPQDRPVRNED